MSKPKILTDVKNVAHKAYVWTAFECANCEGRGHMKPYISCVTHNKHWSLSAVAIEQYLPCGCEFSSGIVPAPEVCPYCDEGFIWRLVPMADFVKYIQCQPPKVQLQGG